MRRVVASCPKVQSWKLYLQMTARAHGEFSLRSSHLLPLACPQKCAFDTSPMIYMRVPSAVD